MRFTIVLFFVVFLLLSAVIAKRSRKQKKLRAKAMKALSISMPGYNYCGPGSDTMTALKDWKNNKPINVLDLACFYHDMDYFAATPADVRAADLLVMQRAEKILVKNIKNSPIPFVKESGLKILAELEQDLKSFKVPSAENTEKAFKGLMKALQIVQTELMADLDTNHVPTSKELDVMLKQMLKALEQLKEEVNNVLSTVELPSMKSAQDLFAGVLEAVAKSFAGLELLDQAKLAAAMIHDAPKLLDLIQDLIDPLIVIIAFRAKIVAENAGAFDPMSIVDPNPEHKNEAMKLVKEAHLPEAWGVALDA